MNDCLVQFDTVTITLLSLSIMLLAGFLVTRVTKRLKLPNVSGYIIAGILIGPYILNLIPGTAIKGMSFVGDIALAFIAFDVGKFMRKEIFLKSGRQAIIITFFESLIPGIMISLTMFYLFNYDLSFSLLLGAISTATAPASTMMTINQYRARGEFVHTLLQVVALDDVIALILFSVASAVISANATGSLAFAHIILPIIYNIVSMIAGFLAGILLEKLLAPDTRSNSNRLILVISILLAISGVCAIYDISPLLSCMVFGATYINTTDDKKLYTEINHFTPPILSLFFVLSGINLDIGTLYTLGIAGVAYFLIRIIGKYIGAYLGSSIVGKNESIKRYLGLALIPQAGVSIGLAFLGQRMLPPEVGNKLMTIILSSAVLYELVGPVAAKTALFKSGAIRSNEQNRR